MNGNGHRPPIAFPPSAIPIVGQPFTLEAWFVQILVTCKCEHPTPVLIIGVPGQGGGQCRSCGKLYGLAAIGIDPKTGVPQFQISMGMPAPAADDQKAVVPS